MLLPVFDIDEFYDEDAVGNGHPRHEDDSEEGLNIESRAREPQRARHTRQSQRHGDQDDERLRKRTKQGDQHQIYQHHGQAEAIAEIGEGLLEIGCFAAHPDFIAFPRLNRLQTLFDFFRHRADVTARYIGEILVTRLIS